MKVSAFDWHEIVFQVGLEIDTKNKFAVYMQLSFLEVDSIKEMCNSGNGTNMPRYDCMPNVKQNK